MGRKRNKAEETENMGSSEQLVEEQLNGEAESKNEGEVDAAGTESLLAEKEDQITALNKELLYLRAEMDNFKKRSEKRYRESLRYAEEPFLKDLLPIIDNLERAFDHAREGGEEGFVSLVEGLGHVIQHLNDVLGRHGVEPVQTQNVKFDPAVHEALAQVPGEESGQVASTFEKGYVFRGRLIRPAKVCVTKVA